MNPSHHNRQAPDLPRHTGRRPGKALGRLLPLLIFILFGLFILNQEVPAVNDKIRSILHPQAWQAIKTCREAALTQSDTPDFARLVKYGEANTTRGGFFIDDLVIGEMDEQSGERRIAITCHIDQQGKLIQMHRKTSMKPPPSESTPPRNDMPASLETTD